MSDAETVTLVVALIVLLYAAGLINAAHAIMKARTPQSSIAWGMGLILFPALAIPLYWVFGSSRFTAYTEKLRDVQKRHHGLVEQMQAAVKPFRAELPPEEAATQRFLERLTNLPLTEGNRIDLLVDGRATFDAILAEIETAERYVVLEFFIVRDDGLGQRLKDLLIRKAEAGVRIYLLCDWIGSYGLDAAYLAQLQEAGVACEFFKPTVGFPGRFRINFRNHRKIVVVDGRTAFVGGHNVGDEYLGENPKFGHWRDTHVRIEGPAVQAAQLTFLMDWYWMTETIPDFEWRPTPSPEGNVRIISLGTGPNLDVESCRFLMAHAVNSARDRLWMASPYFVPDEGFVQGLQMAALRGVDVRIIIPQKSDARIVDLASLSYMRDLASHGVKVYCYRGGFLHEKVFLVDDRWASVGTANVDNRSFRLNFEISTLVFDQVFCDAVGAMFEDDFAQSEELAGDIDEQWSWFRRVAIQTCRLLAPLL